MVVLQLQTKMCEQSYLLIIGYGFWGAYPLSILLSYLINMNVVNVVSIVNNKIEVKCILTT